MAVLSTFDDSPEEVLIPTLNDRSASTAEHFKPLSLLYSEIHDNTAGGS